MINLIVDSSLIIRHPQLLNINNPNFKIIITKDVVYEIEFLDKQNGSCDISLTQLLHTAIEENSIFLAREGVDEDDEEMARIKPANLTNTNKSILSLAVHLRKQGEDVKVCLREDIIPFFFKEHKINSIKKTDIETILAKSSIKSKTVQEQIKAYFKMESKEFTTGIIWGLIISAILLLSYQILKNLLPTRNISVLLILGSIVLGLGLFWFRERFRLIYGVVEIGFSILGIIFLFVDLDSYEVKAVFNSQTMLQFVGCLYIMVRGQDNIVKYVKDRRIGFILRENFGIGA